MKNKIIYILTFILAVTVLSGCGNKANMSVVFIEGIGQDKAGKEQFVITDLISKWTEPQSEDVIADFYDGWDIIGEGEDNKPAEKDTDEALDAVYRDYFTEEGWTYFQSFMLPVTIVATENEYTLSAENLLIEALTDGYDVTFDLKHYKGDDAGKAATINSVCFRFYFKDGKICKIDFPNGIITPQFFAE